jgi:hypothetical protein
MRTPEEIINLTWHVTPKYRSIQMRAGDYRGITGKASFAVVPLPTTEEKVSSP